MPSLSREARDREHAEILRRSGDLWEPLRGERIFVTGGTGFVGTWLMEAFVAANRTYDLGAEVVLLTRDPKRVAERTPELFADPALCYIAGDATSFAEPDGRFAFVIHAATEKPFVADAPRPTSVLEPDFVATRRVLDFARSHGTRRLLFTSSGAVYGRQPSTLTHTPESYTGAPDTMDPRSAYGESKRLSELASVTYATTAEFEVTIARLFAFVGPYLSLDEGFAVGNFINDIMHERAISIAGDGTPYRSYLYAADLAVWCWTILLRGQGGRAYNVGSDDGLSIRGLADRVASCLAPGTEIRAASVPVAGAAPARYVPNVDRARSELALDVWTSLEEGIRRTYEAGR